MMNKIFIAAILLALTLISGCDNRKKLTSTSIPFSIGGIALGAAKNSLNNSNELMACSPESNNKAKCYVNDTNVQYDFFGANAHLVSVQLYAPYTNIAEISIAIKGKSISKHEIESAWKLNGKCLNSYDIDASHKFDSETSGYFARTLKEFNLLPIGAGDFICLADDNSFIKYNQYSDKTEGSVDIYYLKDVFANNYRYLFKSKSAYDNAKNEISKAFAKKPEKTEINRCKGYNPNGEEHGKQMDKLALDAGYKDAYADKYFTSFVSELCTGEIDDAKEYVSSGYVPIRTAQFTAKHFNISIQFAEPSAKALKLEETRYSLVGLGICQACAGNAAMHAVIKPNSECGVLVKSALSGNQSAIDKIDELPTFCEWKF